MAKQRLDLMLVERGFETSREKARATIMSGCVYVNGQRADKAGQSYPEDCELEVRKTGPEFVSRGGLKLEKALNEFEVSPEGCICLDCGASTGGFTDCLLKRGAEKVYAVDVGYGQLAWSIRNDPRVVTMERTNIRHVTHEQIPENLDLCTIDVSFISLKLVLPVLRQLLREGGEVICLVKPQFEAGREKVGKKGVVREPAVHREVLENFLKNADEADFSVMAMSFSPIRGPEGNIEYLARLVTGRGFGAEIDTDTIVSASHAALEKSP